MIRIFCDGGARGNPGPAAGAFVVYDKLEKLIHKDSRYLGTATNNVAEYEALLLALEWLLENQNEDVQIILDSQLVQKQMKGEYKIKNATLQSLALKAKTIERSLTINVSYLHTPRAGNPEADALVNETLDAHASVT